MRKGFAGLIILLVLLSALLGFLSSVAGRLALFEIFVSLSPTSSVFGTANVLILGVDDVYGSRSDTIMVLHINPDQKLASVLSIPRDTLVTIPGRGLDKINHAYAYGGISLTKKTVEDFLRISLPYHVVVNLTGIEELIDKLGGITINVEKRMYYVDFAGDLKIDLQPGRQKLSGKQAMGYLRYRQSDSDFARIRRQQNFLKALADQVMDRENLARSPGLFLSLLSCVETNLNSREILGLSLALRGAHETGQIKMSTIPGTDFMVDGVYYWKPSEEQINQLVKKNLSEPNPNLPENFTEKGV